MSLHQPHGRSRAEESAQLIEPAKNFLFARGSKCSATSKAFITDLAKVKGREIAKVTTQKHEVRPFEDDAELQALVRKSDCALFAFATESPKRPNNIVFGRTFDGEILDMMELGLTRFEAMADVQRRAGTQAASSYSAPLLLFRGEEFGNAHEGSELDMLHSLFVDLFRGRPAKEMDLEAIDLALVFTYVPNSKIVQMRGYRVAFAERGGGESNVPRIKLLEHGPNCDFEMRRSRIAAPNIAKLARKQAKLPGMGKTKNVSTDLLRGTVGQIHMHKQDTSKIVTRSRFSKVLKRKSGRADNDDDGAAIGNKKQRI